MKRQTETLFCTPFTCTLFNLSNYVNKIKKYKLKLPNAY